MSQTRQVTSKEKGKRGGERHTPGYYPSVVVGELTSPAARLLVREFPSFTMQDTELDTHRDTRYMQ